VLNMEVINLEKYPLDQGRDNKEYKKCVADLKSKLLHDGVATCPNFLNVSAVNEAVKDISKVESKAWKTDTTHNIYLDLGDSDFPSDHIRNKLLPTTVASVAYDCLPKSGVLARLYETDAFVEFLKDVLDQPVLYRLEDPFGACSINLFKPGWAHAWHFDESPFSTTIMLQTAQEGGHFEHTLPIRGGRGGGNKNNKTLKSEEDKVSVNKHYEQMTKLVDGSTDQLVQRLEFEPGTLSIFQGNECLHRVAKCEGDKNRLVAVLCYAARPGVKNSKEVQEMFWGRSAE